MTFSYRSKGGDDNKGQMCKSGAEKVRYTISFDDGVPSNITISSAASVATNSAGSTVTTSCVNATTVSGTSVTVDTLTCGASSGTAPATDGGRFQIVTTATLSNNDILVFSTYILIQAGTYAPA